jgi:hypothetical protein
VGYGLSLKKAHTKLVNSALPQMVLLPHGNAGPTGWFIVLKRASKFPTPKLSHTNVLFGYRTRFDNVVGVNAGYSWPIRRRSKLERFRWSFEG